MTPTSLLALILLALALPLCIVAWDFFILIVDIKLGIDQLNNHMTTQTEMNLKRLKELTEETSCKPKGCRCKKKMRGFVPNKKVL